MVNATPMVAFRWTEDLLGVLIACEVSRFLPLFPELLSLILIPHVCDDNDIPVEVWSAEVLNPLDCLNI